MHSTQGHRLAIATPRQGGRLGRIFRGAIATRASSRRADGSGAPSGRRAPLLALAALALAAFLGSAAPAAAAAAEACPNAALRTEQHSTFLPDCRAYEMVSPPDKNGGDVLVDSTHVRTAAAEAPGLPMAASFDSLTAFGDAHGTGVGTEYLSQRTEQPGTPGWTTHGITPAQQPLSVYALAFAWNPAYETEFSPDLSTAVFNAYSPLTEAPNVAAVNNLYLRRDLRTPGAGTYQLLTDASAPQSPAFFLPSSHFDGASADYGHVLFDSFYDLTPDAPEDGQLKFYEWDHGTVRLASVLPGETPSSSGCFYEIQSCVPAGGLGSYTRHMISADGRRVFFMRKKGEGCGGGCFDLYMRVDHAETVRLNTAEGVAQPSEDSARFQDASANGTKVFFTDSRPLIPESPPGEGTALYMYDVNAPAGHHLTLISKDEEPADGTTPGATPNGVIGASEDGSYVYFVGHARLVAGAPVTGERLLYLWHEGEGLRYIGNVTDSDEEIDAPNLGTQKQLDARVTPDGKHLLFVASDGAGLLSNYGRPDYDQTSACEHGNYDYALGCGEFYVYSADANQLTCASCDPSGAPVVSEAFNSVTGETGLGSTLHLTRPLSADGRRVFFDTAEPLVPQDTNGRVDAYEYVWDGSDPASGTVHLLSSGTDPSDSYFMEASADGNDAFFLTRQRLLGWDRDGATDLYDARAGGGLPEPPTTPAPCEGDACRTTSTPPNGASAGTPNFAGPGNRHRRRHHKRSHHHKRQRRANHNRRASR